MQRSRRYFTALLVGICLSGTALAARAADNPQVTMKTSMGEITIELYPAKAPKTVENFLQYVKSGHYSGTVFHRVIDGFMIQGGGFDKDMNEKPTKAPVENEAKNGLKNDAYTVAMARRPNPHSATAQFFINVANNAPLNYPAHDGWGYCVFGKVIKGTDVVDKIKTTPVANRGPYEAVPVTPVVIESAKVTK